MVREFLCYVVNNEWMCNIQTDVYDWHIEHLYSMNPVFMAPLGNKPLPELMLANPSRSQDAKMS